MPDNSAPLKLHGTLAVPPSVAQGQILPPTASVNNGAVDEEYSERLQRLVSELDLGCNKGLSVLCKAKSTKKFCAKNLRRIHI
ncbi:hypothetical protein H4Q26_006627 [Puccinia striiformis f. sp. tritici PST-130]|nr:hypothetical protein H4Q26_006627 [Puccinia striiformis f. sp. tritici PST-130]